MTTETKDDIIKEKLVYHLIQMMKDNNIFLEHGSQGCDTNFSFSTTPSSIEIDFKNILTVINNTIFFWHHNKNFSPLFNSKTILSSFMKENRELFLSDYERLGLSLVSTYHMEFLHFLEKPEAIYFLKNVRTITFDVFAKHQLYTAKYCYWR